MWRCDGVQLRPFSHSGIRLSIRLLRLHPTGCRNDAEASIDDGSCLIPVEGCSNISGIYSLCTGNLVDTVLTYCPDDPANAIQMYILSGALENLADYLYVYDGTDTTATLLGEPLTDQLNDNLFQATNESGMLDHSRGDRRVLVLCGRLLQPHQIHLVLRVRGVHRLHGRGGLQLQPRSHH